MLPARPTPVPSPDASPAPVSGASRTTSGARSGHGFGWPSRWTVLPLLIAALLSIPVLVVFAHVFMPAGEVWAHLKATVLGEYVRHSLLILLGVGVGVLLIGVTTAWLVAVHEFPGRRIFQWALMLPLAMPAYIIAYTYSGLLGFSGPVQGLIRDVTGLGFGQYWFPEIHSVGGVIVLMSLVLYPYVYLLARAAFIEQSVCVLEVSRTLGQGPFGAFRRVALPLARPAIVAGLTLALMEALADYGTVAYLGVSTFTTGIFRTWFGLGDPAAAAQLAALLLSFVFVLIVLERYSRLRMRFHHTSTKYSELPRTPLKGWKAIVAIAVCLLPILGGFLIPATQLAIWTAQTPEQWWNPAFGRLVVNSFTVAAVTALVAVGLAVLLAYAKRLQPRPATVAAVRVASMGYAVPGVVIAVGVMLPFAWIDRSVDDFFRAQFDVSTGLLLSGTLVALVFGLTVRFLAVSLNTVEAGLAKIKPSMDDAARSLGRSPGRTLWDIHLPLMRGTLLTALLLVFVDVLKELPATMILRPFDFNTLAVRAFELASDERLAAASSAALAIVLVGLLPVILLSVSIGHSRAGERQARAGQRGQTGLRKGPPRDIATPASLAGAVPTALADPPRALGPTRPPSEASP